MNAQETTKGCGPGKATSILSVIRSTSIAISISTAVGAALGAIIGAAMNDLGSGFVWGVVAGAGAPSILTALNFMKIKNR